MTEKDFIQKKCIEFQSTGKCKVSNCQLLLLNDKCKFKEDFFEKK